MIAVYVVQLVLMVSLIVQHRDDLPLVAALTFAAATCVVMLIGAVQRERRRRARAVRSRDDA